MRKYSGLFKWLLFLLVAAALARYIYLHRDEFPSLRQVSLLVFGTVCLAETFFFLSNALYLRLLTGCFEKRVPFLDCFKINTQAGLASYLTPLRGGFAIRGIYLWQVHGIRLSSFVAIAGATALLDFVVVGTVGFFCYLALDNRPPILLAILILLVVAASATLLFIGITRSKKVDDQPEEEETKRSLVSSIALKFRRVLWGIGIICRKPFVLAGVVFLLLFNSLLRMFSIWLVYSSLGDPISFPAAYLIDTIWAFASILNITPANLGVQEAALSFAGMGIGKEFDVGLVVAGILRLANFSVTCLWGGLSFLAWVKTGQTEIKNPKAEE